MVYLMWGSHIADTTESCCLQEEKVFNKKFLLKDKY